MSQSKPLPANQNPADPNNPSLDNAYTDLADGTLRRPIQCACGKRLLIRVAREGVILRCPDHGVQFRYEVDPRVIKAGRK